MHKAPEYGSNMDPDPLHWSVVTSACLFSFCGSVGGGRRLVDLPLTSVAEPGHFGPDPGST